MTLNDFFGIESQSCIFVSYQIVVIQQADKTELFLKLYQTKQQKKSQKNPKKRRKKSK